MATLNEVRLIGNLARDPELRVLPNGNSVCQFAIAVNREFKDANGQKREEVAFVDCEAWGKTGELVSKYLGKGSQCLVGGRLRQDSWEDKTDGKKRSRLKVVLDNVQFLGAPRGKQDSEPKTETYYQPSDAPPPTRQAPAAPPPDNSDEDVPFSAVAHVTA